MISLIPYRCPPPAPQLYDASVSPATPLGAPVVLNITDGTGTDADPYVASLGPASQPMRITAAGQATGGAGGSTSALSAQSNVAVVGEPWAHMPIPRVAEPATRCIKSATLPRAYATLRPARPCCSAPLPLPWLRYPAGLPLVPQIESLTGSKTELRLTWLKNDTTATSYRIAGEPAFQQSTMQLPVK